MTCGTGNKDQLVTVNWLVKTVQSTGHGKMGTSHVVSHSADFFKISFKKYFFFIGADLPSVGLFLDRTARIEHCAPACQGQ
jgi:hypothetical protein